MHVRAHVYAAALLCLSLPILSADGPATPPTQPLLAGKIVHADAAAALDLKRPEVPPRAPVCRSGNPHGDYGLVAVIARPRGTRASMTAGAFRKLIAAADGVVYQQAEESGAPGADLVFDCDSTGAVRVDVVTLPTALARTTFDTVVADLGSLGYKRSNEKYVVWLDGRPPDTLCGTSDIVSDQEPGARNRVAIGPDWAVSFGCNSVLHETMHVLGAVGFDAPHGTGLGHCWDGNPRSDVMCYDDGGPSVPPTGVKNPCGGGSLHLDCGHDDYFAAGPVPASSYLASHWNVAGCYDRFLVDYGCPGTVPPRPRPPELHVVTRRRAGHTIRLGLRLSSLPTTSVSVAYRSGAGRGRVVFPRGRAVATLSVPESRASQRVVITFSDPRGLWLSGTRVPFPAP